MVKILQHFERGLPWKCEEREKALQKSMAFKATRPKLIVSSVSARESDPKLPFGVESVERPTIKTVTLSTIIISKRERDLKEQ